VGAIGGYAIDIASHDGSTGASAMTDSDSGSKLLGNSRLGDKSIGSNGSGSFAKGIGVIVLSAAMVAALLLLSSQFVGL
jgi:hypothetical protein